MQKQFAVVTGVTMLFIAGVVAYQASNNGSSLFGSAIDEEIQSSGVNLSEGTFEPDPPPVDPDFDQCEGKSICAIGPASVSNAPVMELSATECPKGCYAKRTSRPCKIPGELPTSRNNTYPTVIWPNNPKYDGAVAECKKIKLCCQETAMSISSPSDKEVTKLSWKFVDKEEDCKGNNKLLVNAQCCIDAAEGKPDHQNACT